MKRLFLAVLVTLVGLAPRPALAQALIWDDLIFTGGFAVETYNGNFSAVTIPLVDSTDHAAAAVGEFGTRGRFRFPDAKITVAFDAGLRQFAASGFELRDYAPRELAGRVDVGWGTGLGRIGSLDITGTARGRRVEDRPPVPLFLQPGYRNYRIGSLYRSPVIQDVRFDLGFDVESTDYQAPDVISQLDILDRRSWRLEAGAGFGPLVADPAEGGWSVRIHSAYRASRFRDQPSFDPSDPFRRDGTVEVGAMWTWEGPVYAQMGVDGTVNRSNSRRPEYDAISLRSQLYSPLPVWDLGVNLLAVITGKTYVHEAPFARLVPGEEADNASVVFLDLNRPVTPALDTALRFGWTRAETEIGDAYYSRFGITFLMNYRPPGL